MTTWPTVVELVGQTGAWDYVEFVAEYAPWTLHDLDNLARAAELFPDFTAMIKIEQDLRGHLAMRAIGSGIQNVLFADVRTADDARACVRSVRPEHPDHGGLHGVGMRRDVRTVLYGGSSSLSTPPSSPSPSRSTSTRDGPRESGSPPAPSPAAIG